MTKTSTIDIAATHSVGVKRGAPSPRTRQIRRLAKERGLLPYTDIGGPTPAETSARRERAGPAKIASDIVLFRRERGITLRNMIQATGWLPQTTRTALSGLKSKGPLFNKPKLNGMSCHYIIKD